MADITPEQIAAAFAREVLHDEDKPMSMEEIIAAAYREATRTAPPTPSS